MYESENGFGPWDRETALDVLRGRPIVWEHESAAKSSDNDSQKRFHFTTPVALMTTSTTVSERRFYHGSLR